MTDTDTTAADIGTVDYDRGAAEVMEDPFPTYAEMRERCPVHRFDELLGASGPSMVADNSAAGAVVLGGPVAVPDSLASVAVRLLTGDDELAAGTGAAVLGTPLRSLEWRLSHERRSSRKPASGTVVITGSQELFDKPVIPPRAFRLMGNLGWRFQARRHGAWRSLKRRPYQRTA